MILSVASGKGGTGKTTLATALVTTLAGAGKEVTYVDCDVEEPNGRIFLRPEIEAAHDVQVMIPHVDLDKCSFCGECSRICQFNAIAVILDKVMTFPSLCHSCGGCYHICPERAIEEVPRSIGEISQGTGSGVRFYEGRLTVGEALSPPVTRNLKKTAQQSQVVVIDAPPGTSCPVIEAIADTDYVILVTEPTPFGLNDLKLAVGMVRELGIPFGVVINRSDIGDDRAVKYCDNEGITVLIDIPFDRGIAEAYSAGKIVSFLSSGYRQRLCGMYDKIEKTVGSEGSRNSKR